MLFIILLPLLTNCLKLKVKCQIDSITQVCDHLIIYFNPTYPIRINSFIQFMLPFELQGQETLEISSFDESTIPIFTLNGNTYYMLTQILPENTWYKCNLTLTTVYSQKEKGIGQFQMNIVASQLSNTLILEKGDLLTLSYSIQNQIYTPIIPTILLPVIPLTVGTTCTISDWSSTIVKNSVRQQQSMTFSLSADTTNDRLDIQLTLDSINTNIIYHKECYMSGSEITKYKTECILQQKGLIITFQLRSDNPILLIASTEYLIEFYISHQGDTITSNTFTAQIFHGTQIIDQCQSSKTFLIDESDSSTYSKTITDVKMYIDTPNIGVNTFFGIFFQPKQIQYDTLIRIELGFLTYNQLFCQVYQQEMNTFIPSITFSHYNYDSSNLYFYSNKYKIDNTPYSYSINCTGIQIKQTINQMFRIVYEDLYHTVIQFYQIRQPSKLPSLLTQSTISLNIIKYIQLIKKQFNNPLFTSIITFQIKPIYGIMRVIIEFPYQYSTNCIKCLLNQTETYCKQDILNSNRIIIYLLKYENSNLITQQFQLTIYGMVNPQQLIYGSKILIMLDDDDIMEPLLFNNQNDLNGIIFYEYIDDYIDDINYKYLDTQNFKFSQSIARIYDVYLIGNITFQMNSIKEENTLYLRISNQYYIYNLNCLLYKIGDTLRNNYIKNCSIQQNYIKMDLIQDNSNLRFSQQFQINISYFRTQDLILQDQNGNLQPMIQLFIAKDDNILFFENQVNGQFVMKTNKIPFYWYSVNSDGLYERLETKPGFENIPTYKMNLNYFTDKRLFLGLGDVTDRFNCTINLILPEIHQDIILYGQSSKYSKQSFSSQTITLPKYMVKSITDDTHFETIKDTELIINPGDSGFIFNIASKKLINIQFKVQLNYTITFPERNSWNPVYYYNPYTEIPILYLEIENINCELIPQKSQYDLPLNGYTHPIIIDPQGCIPIIDKKLNVTIENNNYLELIPIQLTLSRYRYELIKRTTKQLPEYTYLFQIKATNQTKQGITTQVIVNTFAITILTIQQNEDKITNTPLIGKYSELSNSISLTMSCNQPSEIILVIATDEISDDSFKQLEQHDISQELIGDYDLFKIEPQNATLLQESSHLYKYEIQPISLIMDIYNNKIGNTISYNEYDIVNQVNQSLIKDNSYKTLMNSIRRMMIARMSLIDKTSQLHLRRIQTKMNFFETPQSFLLTNLKYKDKYSFGYYCKNLTGHTSDISTNFLYISKETNDNNKTKGNMLQLKFKEKITPLQENNILCAFAQYFSINYYQVLSKQCKQCRFQNIFYEKINYSEYQQLIIDFIPYDNRSTTDKQKFLDNLYTMTLYFNNYPSSNGNPFDIKYKIDKQINLTNETILNILNITDDLKLNYLYESFSYSELKPQKKSDNELATQVVLIGYEFKTISMDITIKANYDVLAFVGLHKIEPIYENVIKHPTGIMLRRGILGTFSNISEGVQFAELVKDENITLTFKNLDDGQKYLLYYSSTDMQNDCLTKQYQETVVQQITFFAAQQSLDILLKIFNILLIILAFI